MNPTGEAYASVADYHADHERVSTTMLKLLDESPAKFHARYIAKTLPFKDSPELRLGRMFHVLTLQPHLFHSLCPQMPPFHLDLANVTATGKRSSSKSTTYYQNAVAAFEAEHAGKDICTDDDLMLMQNMRQAMSMHDDVRPLLFDELGGVREVINRWHNILPRRAMLDFVRTDCHIVADVKTMSEAPTPRAFAKACAKWRWYLQDANYTEAAEDAFGPGPWRFVFICVSKEPPHEVAVHELTQADKERSRIRLVELLEELAERKASNNWLAPWQSGVVESPLPPFTWTDRRFNYDLEGDAA